MNKSNIIYIVDYFKPSILNLIGINKLFTDVKNIFCDLPKVSRWLETQGLGSNARKISCY